MFSDNGTNFKGAERELAEAVALLDKDKIMAEFASRNIKWSYIPPAAPHMGGAWERLVQSVKKVLKVILNERYPKDESLRCFLMEAEKMVNSRPIVHEPVELDREEMLTPNHFLIGTSSVDAVDALNTIELSMSKQWELSQTMANHFWKRWTNEYLPTLIRREKWHEKQPNVEVGAVVIIVDDKFPRSCWMKVIITQVFPGKDLQVRVAEIRTSTGLFKRPVSKIIVLDVTKDSE